jgi:hypothetical protein
MNHIARQASAFNSLNGEMNALWAEVEEAKATGRQWVPIRVNGGFGKRVSLQIRIPTNAVCLVLKTDAIRAAKKAAIGKLDWESLPHVIYLVMIFGGCVDGIMWLDETLDAEEVHNIAFRKRGAPIDLSALSDTQQKLLGHFMWLSHQLELLSLYPKGGTSYRMPHPRPHDQADGTTQFKITLAREAELFKRRRKVELSEDDLDRLFGLSADDDDYDDDDGRPDMSAAELALHFEDRDESDGENEYGPEGAGFIITDPEA